MLDLQTIAVLLGAILFGVLCTLLVQAAAAVRKLTDEVIHTSRQVGEIAATLQPTAARLDRMSGMVAESEPDLARLQLALRGFSESSVQVSESLRRISGWLTFAVPLVITAAERWTQYQAGRDAEDPGAEHPTGDGAQQPPPREERDAPPEPARAHGGGRASAARDHPPPGPLP